MQIRQHANPVIDGHRLRYLRQRAGYSLTGLAEKVGCSFGHLGRLEREGPRGVGTALYRRLCDALGVDHDVLLHPDAPRAAEVLEPAGTAA